MKPAGYSGTPLIQKLGIKSGMKILLLNSPDNYFQLLGSDITNQLVFAEETPDLIHLFAANSKVFLKPK